MNRLIFCPQAPAMGLSVAPENAVMIHEKKIGVGSQSAVDGSMGRVDAYRHLVDFLPAFYLQALWAVVGNEPNVEQTIDIANGIVSFHTNAPASG